MRPAIESSSHGFHSTAPEGRVARMAQKDRDMRERIALSQRREGFQRHEVRRNPLEVLTNTSAYAEHSETLRTDVGNFVSTEHSQRHQHRETRRAVMAERTALRSRERELALEKARERAQQRAEKIVGTSRSNVGSVGYDLTTGVWKGGAHEAAVIRYRDSLVEYGAKTRSLRLHQNSNKVGYNILTGEDRSFPLALPPKPSGPPPPPPSKKT
eukprot:PhM_4_TR5826/c0_g2_i1/m.67627